MLKNSELRFIFGLPSRGEAPWRGRPLMAHLHHSSFFTALRNAQTQQSLDFSENQGFELF
ncbi:MAG: hypothetical protein NC207_02095 [Bacteroides sp.]|nr:hypothetical protein [Bacteroides sp.]